MKISVVLAGVGLTAALGWALYRGLASEETRIRWLVQDEVASFNAGSISGCMAGFAVEFEDETTRMDRTSLQHMLLYAFKKHRDPDNGEFLYWVHVPEDRVEITMQNEEQTEAEVVFPVVLSERGAPVWTIRVHALAVRGERGWLFSSSWHQTVVGARPGR